MADPHSVQPLDGPAVREMFATATTWLDQNKELVNSINVFPVPDGDTGTNMYLTMRSTMEEAERCPDKAAGAMLAAMAHGALMGARGNSGVILSQILRGFSRALTGEPKLDAGALARGLEEGSAAAYSAVTKPTEGTILTVIREASEAARASFNGTAPELQTLMETTVDAARESVARTPALLPVLAEAGVVDAGGQGLYVILEGMLKHMRGDEMTAPHAETRAVEEHFLSNVEARHEMEPSPYGYCAEVLIEGQALDVDTMRADILKLGDSVIVVGDEQLVRIHVHTDDPGAVLQRGTAVGQLAKVKIDNINRQAERFVEMHHGASGGVTANIAAPAGSVSYVAVASGDGLAEVFRSTGCEQVVSGGPTMNPSTRELLDAIQACAQSEVIVLPNDKNIILAAEQAAEMSAKKVRVVKSRSVPQGLAALLATNPGESIDENAAAMDGALGTVRTIEITRAVRDVSLDGVEVNEGDVIAVIDDKLTLASTTAEEATVAALKNLVGETSLISLYFGEDTKEAEAYALAERLRSEFPPHEVEVVHGGQPHYLYIASLE